MNIWPRRISIILLFDIPIFSVAMTSGAAQTVVSDTAEVGLVVTGAQESETETATVTPTPTGAALATATDAVGGSSSTVPVVAQLPETGVAPSGSTAPPVLMALLTAGFLLMIAGVLSSRAQCKRSVSR